MALQNQYHPFFDPLWRRLAIVAVTALWPVLELYHGEQGMWFTLSLGMVVYAVYALILKWPQPTPPPDA